MTPNSARSSTDGPRSRCSPTSWIRPWRSRSTSTGQPRAGRTPPTCWGVSATGCRPYTSRTARCGPASPPHSFRPTRSPPARATFRSPRPWPPAASRLRRHRVRPLRRRHLRRHRPELRLPRLDPGGLPMSRTGKVGVGIIGAGMISDQYLTHLTQYPDVEVLTVADLDIARAATQASQYGIANSGDVESVLGNDDVEIVVNLTIPAAHVEVSTAAVRPANTSGARSRSASTATPPRGWSTSPPSAACCWASPRTPCSAPPGRPRNEPSRRVSSASRFPRSPRFSRRARTGSTRDPEFLFAKGAGPLFDIGPVLPLGAGSPARADRRGHRASAPRRTRCGPSAPAPAPEPSSPSRCPRTSM